MKSARVAVLVGLVVLCAVLAGCDKSREWCVETYGLVATEEEAKNKWGLEKKIPAPDPGPRIILKKDETSNKLEWYVYNDNTGAWDKQTAGGRANGKIRADFTGQILANSWKFHYLGNPSGTILNSVRVEAEKASVLLKMQRTVGDGITWHLNHQQLTPDPSQNGSGKVPDEFVSLDLNKLYEKAYVKQGDWTEITFKK